MKSKIDTCRFASRRNALVWCRWGVKRFIPPNRTKVLATTSYTCGRCRCWEPKMEKAK